MTVGLWKPRRPLGDSVQRVVPVSASMAASFSPGRKTGPFAIVGRHVQSLPIFFVHSCAPVAVSRTVRLYLESA